MKPGTDRGLRPVYPQRAGAYRGRGPGVFEDVPARAGTDRVGAELEVDLHPSSRILSAAFRTVARIPWAWRDKAVVRPPIPTPTISRTATRSPAHRREAGLRAPGPGGPGHGWEAGRGQAWWTEATEKTPGVALAIAAALFPYSCTSGSVMVALTSSCVFHWA